MIRKVAIVFCLLVCWNICCHGEEEGEGGKTKSLIVIDVYNPRKLKKEKEGLSCKDVNPDSAIMKREISVSTVKENSTGDWLTAFQADRYLDDSTTAVNLKIKQELVRCGDDKRMVLRITGVVRDIDRGQFPSKKQSISIPEIKEEKKQMIMNSGAKKRDCGYILRFHSDIKGNNVMITDNGKTASRIELKNYTAGVITERPLTDDEIFSIRIDRSDESWAKRKSSTTAFGLISNPTQDIRSSLYVFNKQGTWYSFHSNIYMYGGSHQRYSLNVGDISDGTVLGITRKGNGDVHFFKNGLDMGKAFEGVPKGVYAFFDVINYVSQISVVKEKCFN